jgi:hypothetical protein
LLDHPQIGADRKRVVVAEFEFGHVGMTAGDSAFERAWKFVKVDAAAEVAERWRVGVPAFAFDTDGVAAPAKLRNQCLATSDRVLRLRGPAARTTVSEKNDGRFFIRER